MAYAEHHNEQEAAQAATANQQLAVNIVGDIVSGASSTAGHPEGAVAANVLSDIITGNIEADKVPIPNVPDPGASGVNTQSASEDGVKLVATSQFLKAQVDNGQMDASELPDEVVQHTGNPNTSGLEVTLSKIDEDTNIRELNRDLAAHLPDDANEQISDWADSRSKIVNRYGMVIPERFSGQ